MTGLVLEQAGVVGKDHVHDGDHVDTAGAGPVAEVHPLAVILLLLSDKASPEVGEDGGRQGPGRGTAAGAGGGAAIRRRRARRVILTQHFGSRREGDGRGHPARRGNIPSKGSEGKLPGHLHGVSHGHVLPEHTDHKVVPGRVCCRGGGS